ncbi:MAG: hypothetical protein AAFV71_26190, partial [Cyanobacteria bacterium J06633_8]
MALNIRLTGTKEEIDKSIEQIKQVMNVSEISDYYRHSSKEETFITCFICSIDLSISSLVPVNLIFRAI